ncbi:MAG: hypothetical protein P1P84_08520 [Deferrisomatales bacterium]|nr:hypothetical protein [Deferrisomatales bacterium]
MNEQVGILQFLRPDGVPYAVGILAATIVLANLLTRGFDRLGEPLPGKRLTLSQVGTFTRFGVYLVGLCGATVAVVNLSRDLVLALGEARHPRRYPGHDPQQQVPHGRGRLGKRGKP